MDAKKVDSKGRVLLPPELANAYVIIDKISDNEYRLRTADIVPRAPQILSEDQRRQRLKSFLKAVDDIGQEVEKAWKSDLSAVEAVSRQRR